MRVCCCSGESGFSPSVVGIKNSSMFNPKRLGIPPPTGTFREKNTFWTCLPHPNPRRQNLKLNFKKVRLVLHTAFWAIGTTMAGYPGHQLPAFHPLRTRVWGLGHCFEHPRRAVERVNYSPCVAIFHVLASKLAFDSK